MRFDDGVTQPESARTLMYQFEMVIDGLRSAVMVPSGTKDTLKDVARKFQLGVSDNPAGRFYFNPDLIDSNYVKRCYEMDEIGTLLGYGIPRKPEMYVSAVVVRDRLGIEKQAVITDKHYAKSVLDRAYEIAKEGDTVTVESPETIVQRRKTCLL